jgi:hypothetical protein
MGRKTCLRWWPTRRCVRFCPLVCVWRGGVCGGFAEAALLFLVAEGLEEGGERGGIV